MNGKKMTTEAFDSSDATDLAILSVLQGDGRLGVTEIARRVSLSQPAVSIRIKRLERAGIITGYRAVVDPRRVGLSIHAVVRLRTTHARITAALDHFATAPEITSAYRLTGEDCFLIDIHAASAEQLETLVDSIARFGPVTPSLVLRSYPPKPVTPAPPSRSAPSRLA